MLKSLFDNIYDTPFCKNERKKIEQREKRKGERKRNGERTKKERMKDSIEGKNGGERLFKLSAVKGL